VKRTVYVVDDDAVTRTMVAQQLLAAGYAVREYDSAQDFLDAYNPAESPSCLLLDVQMPGMSGLDLQHELNHRGIELPIVFLTAQGDVPMSVQTMKAGADHFLLKPAKEKELLEAIAAAVDRSVSRLAASAELRALRDRHAQLTPREREVFVLVVSGLPNKVIAADLGLAEITVKVHRASVMHKMRAESLAALVRMASALENSQVKAR